MLRVREKNVSIVIVFDFYWLTYLLAGNKDVTFAVDHTASTITTGQISRRQVDMQSMDADVELTKRLVRLYGIPSWDV